MSTQFTDKKGRVWDLQLDLLIARQVDASDFSTFGFGVDGQNKFSILRPERLLLQKLITDAPFLFAVIWAMVQKQAEEKWKNYQKAKVDFDTRGSLSTYASDDGFSFSPPSDSLNVSPKEKPEETELDFISGINGPVIESARQAFIEALSDFFPDLRIVLSVLLRQTRSLAEKAAKKLKETEPLLQQIMEEEMDRNLQTLRNELKTRNGQPGVTSTPSQPQPDINLETSGSPA